MRLKEVCRTIGVTEPWFQKVRNYLKLRIEKTRRGERYDWSEKEVDYYLNIRILKLLGYSFRDLKKGKIRIIDLRRRCFGFWVIFNKWFECNKKYIESENGYLKLK